MLHCQQKYVKRQNILNNLPNQPLGKAIRLRHSLRLTKLNPFFYKDHE